MWEMFKTYNLEFKSDQMCGVNQQSSQGGCSNTLDEYLYNTLDEYLYNTLDKYLYNTLDEYLYNTLDEYI